MPFLGLTFLITWGLMGFYILLPARAAALLGPLSGTHPVFFLATWSPAIAGLAVTALYGGRSAPRALLSRLLIWRIPWVWPLFILVVLPGVFVAGALMKGGPVLAPLPPGGAGAVVATLFTMLALGPVEELGWRGVLQPLLQRRVAPFWAGAAVGATWGLWHLPAFFLAGTVFADWNFVPFFVGNVVLAILVTPILNGSGGSLLWPMLFHWQLINPLWPDAQPFDTWILLAVTAIVAWISRADLFTRGGVTDVLPAPKTRPAGPG
nr:CPBP family intramembrane glutamic endopeptidase [Palleronia pontilimi]